LGGLILQGKGFALDIPRQKACTKSELFTTRRGERIWIITELERAVGTTVLLPEEY
jgi:hypothetical protein